MPQSYSPVYFPQDWSSVSMSAANKKIDSCSDNLEDNIGNYCTLNAINPLSHTLAEGNLKATAGATGRVNYGTIAIPTTGKWYWEAKVVSQSPNQGAVGIKLLSSIVSTNTDFSLGSGGYGMFQANNSGLNGHYFENSGTTVPGGGASQNITWAVNDIVNIAYSADDGKIWFGKNNTYYSNFTNGTSTTVGGSSNFGSIPSGVYVPAVAGTNGGGASAYLFNFGSNAFSYTPPTGYKAINTANLAAPTVTKPDDFFKTLLYTGNGSTLAVTGAGFQPDFVWLKCRSVATNWNVVDVVRGADAMLRMASSTNTEQSGANQEFESFDADGFTVIDHTGVVEELNRSGATYVGYCMKAGGSASSNGNGSITSSVSAASHGGFSIGTFTTGTNGAITIGHGLSRAPDIVIVKDRESSGQYWTYLGPEGAGKYVALNSDGASASSTAVWNNTAPTSSVFSTQDNGAWLTAGNDHVFYAFAKTPGLIGIGSYTGNGSADGPMVTVDDGASGFKPAWLMVKRTSSADDWKVSNSVMSPFNPVLTNSNLNINTAAAADTPSGPIDYLANGFKPRLSNGPWNASGNSYIYLAFAENPFGGSGIEQARAR
jgi:hypothetical protein